MGLRCLYALPAGLEEEIDPHEFPECFEDTPDDEEEQDCCHLDVESYGETMLYCPDCEAVVGDIDNGFYDDGDIDD